VRLFDALPPAGRIAEPFTRALAEVCELAHRGKPPAECAVVYRSLAREHPHHADWLNRWANMWAHMGDSWGGVKVVPSPDYTDPTAHSPVEHAPSRRHSDRCTCEVCMAPVMKALAVGL
jgi:hypothetical protein